jgi:putative glycosyltransferase (TIGR04348 family)
MRVLLVCPAPRGSRSGNRRTAERWSRILRSLGHEVRTAVDLEDGARADLLVALHAGRSAAAVRRSRELAPARPIVVALTGTDLSRDIHVDADARRSLALADRLIVLHDLAWREVPAPHRPKIRLLRQSARPPRASPARATRTFDVVVVGHLRDVKDPLRTALAVRLLPPSSPVRVLHAGGPLDPSAARAALREQKQNPRYRWLGELPPARALRLIARAHVFVLTSRSEGGANVLGEAVMCGTPIIASDIAAARAALGADYPALFPVGDESALAALIARAQADPRWLADLSRIVRARRPLFEEKAERQAWRGLLAELGHAIRGRRAGGAGLARSRV